MHDVRRVRERRPPQTTRVRRRPEPQLVHYLRPRVRPVDDVLVPPEPGVAAAIPKQRREELVLVVFARDASDTLAKKSTIAKTNATDHGSIENALQRD